jgi:polygalacturonase
MNLNRKTTFLMVLGMLSLPLLFIKTSQADSPTTRVFDVKESGAKGDGKTLDTDAIQKALDECGKAGGGTVRFPAGTYLSKPIVLRSSSTIVQLDAGATLLATDDPADFAGSRSNYFIPFVSGKNLHDVTITGQGIIDGSGAKWWIPAEAARQKTPGYTLPRPNLVVLTGCTNLRIENITLQNSPKYHFVPTDCDGVIVSNVTILAPAGAANTDAIDPSVCRNVLITKCRIDVGDDNVAIKSGRVMPGRPFACDNITITDCTCLHGHGISIGGETVGGVRNVTVRNCTFENTENGIRIKSQRGRGGIVENISYSGITMKNVDPAISLTCYYMFNSAGDAQQKSEPTKDTAQAVVAGTPIYRNIHISNLTATCHRGAGIIIGLPESLISDVTLENVQITSTTTGLKIQNAKGIQFKNVQITARQGPPVIMDNAEVTGMTPAK